MISLHVIRANGRARVNDDALIMGIILTEGTHIDTDKRIYFGLVLLEPGCGLFRSPPGCSRESVKLLQEAFTAWSKLLCGRRSAQQPERGSIL